MTHIVTEKSDKNLEPHPIIIFFPFERNWNTIFSFYQLTFVTQTKIQIFVKLQELQTCDGDDDGKEDT